MTTRIRLATATIGIVGVALATVLWTIWTPVSATTVTTNLAVSAQVSSNCTDDCGTLI